MKKNNDQKRFLMAFISLLSLVVVSVGGFQIWKAYRANTDINSAEMKKDEFYSIRNNATAYQKDIYAELTDLLNQEVRDDTAIAGSVAQNYVADFYTWTNKLRLNDIGGLQFLHDDIKTPVYQQAQQYFYNDMNYYLKRNEVKNTLEVSNVEIVSVDAIDYFINDENGESEITDENWNKIKGDYHQAKVVSLKWVYKESTVIDTKSYDADATVVLVKNANGLYVVVEVNHD